MNNINYAKSKFNQNRKNNHVDVAGQGNAFPMTSGDFLSRIDEHAFYLIDTFLHSANGSMIFIFAASHI